MKYLNLMTDLSFAGQDPSGEKVGIVEDEINRTIMIERRMKAKMWMNIENTLQNYIKELD